MTAAVRIACTAGQYNALSSGQANVAFKAPTLFGGRVVVATSAPSASVTDFVSVGAFEKVSIGSLGATENVYWMPNASNNETVEVLRG